MADKNLFFTTSTLILISVITVYSLSTYAVILYGVGDFHFLIRQALFGFISLVTIFLIVQLDPEKWLHRLGLALFIGGLIAMIAMPFLPSNLVREIGGASRWIRLGPISLAPVEFFKVGFIYFLAWSFSRKIDYHDGMGLKNEFIRFIPYGVLFLIVIFLIAVMQNDFGQVVVLSLTLLFLIMLSGGSSKFFMSLLGLAAVAFVIIIFTADHRIARIKSWWSLAQNNILTLMPDFISSKIRIESADEPYQISHSLNAIHNGGIFGVGLADGNYKLGFLSEVHTDFILAGIAEEFGFVGVLVVSLLFMYLLQRIFKIANRSEDKKIFLFSSGIGMILAFAFIINAFGISGLFPIKGISVPLLSYGGSAMIASSVAIGMVMLASKRVKY